MTAPLFDGPSLDDVLTGKVPSPLPAGEVGQPVFDPVSGEVLSPTTRVDGLGAGCDRCGAERHRADAIEGDLQLALKDGIVKNRKIKALEKELSEQLQSAPEAATVKTLFAYWVKHREKDPKRTKLGEKRTKAVLARLREGHAPERIMRAIDGLKWGAYRNPDTGQVYDDLELVCRDEVHLERFADLADRMDPQAPTLDFPQGV